MSPDRVRRAASMLEIVLELESNLRDSYLDALRAQDPELERLVRSLLLDSQEEATRHENISAGVEGLPSGQIGPYTIVELLGFGGMGDVFLAERSDEEYKRRVAIKVIRRGIDSFEVQQRFLAERQILASFDHPGIGRMYEGGTTDAHRPYLVMEYIDGIRIDRYCDEQKLGITDRLELFLEVCSAVDYAHRNLVVHRDLKPSNVLVTHDGDVKLIDFGVAKLLAPGQLDLEGNLTVTGINPMTPNYASPEQVRGERVSTSSDVYSLGALLFTLLTGKPPVDLTSCGPLEWLNKLEVTRIRRPSELYSDEESTDNATEATLLSLGGKSAAIRRQLKGDIDTLVMAALHEDPDRRYGSVEQLAQDIRNFLEGLPIAARGDSVPYRVTKFARRHVLGLSLLTAVLLAMSLLSLFALRQSTLATRESRAAREALRQAEEARSVEREVATFLVDTFSDASPSSPLAESPTAKELLENQARRLRLDLHADPVLKARFQEVIAVSFSKIGMFEQAAELLEEVVKTRRGELKDEPLEVATALELLGGVRTDQERPKEGEALIREALAIMEADTSPDRPSEHRVALARARFHLASALEDQGRVQEALQIMEPEVMAIRSKSLVLDSGMTISILNTVGISYGKVGRLAEAETAHREALALAREQFGHQSNVNIPSLVNLSATLNKTGNSSQAEGLLDDALNIHENTGALGREGLFNVWFSKGNIRLVAGDFESSETFFRKALEVTRAIEPELSGLAVFVHNALGAVALQQRDLDQAMVEFTEGLALLESTQSQNLVVQADFWNNLGIVNDLLADPLEARRCYQRSIELNNKAYGVDNVRNAGSLANLAHVELDLGQLAEAERLYRSAIELYKSQETPSVSAADAYGGYANLLARQEHEAEAETHYRKALELREAHMAADHPDLQETVRDFVAFLRGMGRKAEAKELEAKLTAESDE